MTTTNHPINASENIDITISCISAFFVVGGFFGLIPFLCGGFGDLGWDPKWLQFGLGMGGFGMGVSAICDMFRSADKRKIEQIETKDDLSVVFLIIGVLLIIIACLT